MRKFYFENEYAQRYDLQSNDAILTDPSSLGVGFDNGYIALGDTFVRDYFKLQQKTLSAVINFKRPNQYEKYQNFVDFVLSAKKLYLIYVPDTQIEYKREIDITNIDKGEIDRDKVLRAPITFTAKTLYYTSNVNKFEIDDTAGFVFPITWPVMFLDYAERSVIIDNDGHAEASLTCTFFGYCVEPAITVYQNDEPIKTCAFNVTIEDGEKVEYSTIDGNLYAYKVDALGNKTNLINAMDINNDNFFKLPLGVSTVKLTSSNELIPKAYLTVYKYYKAV